MCQSSFMCNKVTIVVLLCGRYGELVNINMVRDKATGKTRGFAFLCYEDQRSTVLAVDNFNGMKVTAGNVTFTTGIMRLSFGVSFLLGPQEDTHILDQFE